MSDNFCIAVFGGAVAGSEAVDKMVKNGITVIVFDQNALPYGKIESGLPKWHVKLRDKQEEKIDARLDQKGVYFVPGCALGEDIDFNDIVKNWGFSAVLLATGAWKDRTLPMKGIDAYINKGFYYQNPFVQWFNLCHDPKYSGQQYAIEDNAMVIGGGLASIDVAKILMIENFRKAIRKFGKDLDTNSIERLGLPEAARTVDLSLEKIGLKGCKIYYRRRIADMPLSVIADDSSTEEINKGQEVRKKIVQLAENKFLFKVVDCSSPVNAIIEDGKIAGMVMRKNKIENGKAIPVPGSEEQIVSPLIISSIGSVPEKIAGLDQIDEKFDIENPENGKLKGYDNVFVLGNAVTGKGNIKESQLHGRNVSESIIKNYLGISEPQEEQEIKFKSRFSKQLSPISDFVKQHSLSDEQYQSILNKVKDLQSKRGYSNYKVWIEENLPVRLEDMG